MNPVIQEFRDSLPLILEGKDPLIEYGANWYLETLRQYEYGDTRYKHTYGGGSDVL